MRSGVHDPAERGYRTNGLRPTGEHFEFWQLWDAPGAERVHTALRAQLGEMLRQAEQAARRRTAAGDIPAGLRARVNAGLSRLCLGDGPGAAAVLTAALSAAREQAARWEEGYACYALGAVHRAAGRPGAATARFAAAERLFRDCGDARARGHVRLALAVVTSGTEDTGTREHLLAAVDAFRTAGARANALTALWMLSALTDSGAGSGVRGAASAPGRRAGRDPGEGAAPTGQEAGAGSGPAPGRRAGLDAGGGAGSAGRVGRSDAGRGAGLAGRATGAEPAGGAGSVGRGSGPVPGRRAGLDAGGGAGSAGRVGRSDAGRGAGLAGRATGAEPAGGAGSGGRGSGPAPGRRAGLDAGGGAGSAGRVGRSDAGRGAGLAGRATGAEPAGGAGSVGRAAGPAPGRGSGAAPGRAASLPGGGAGSAGRGGGSDAGPAVGLGPVRGDGPGGRPGPARPVGSRVAVGRREREHDRPVASLDGLTRREREVAWLVASGMTNRQIAERMSIAERTVDTHVQRILAKSNCATRVQVAVLVAAGYG